VLTATCQPSSATARLPDQAVWSHDRLPAPFRLNFTSRLGGTSNGSFDSLNLALHVGDDPRRVRENRHRILSALNFSDNAPVIAQQVHGNICVRVERDDAGRGTFTHSDAVEGADALVTTAHGLPLMVFSADCLLVALADPKSGVLGVAHAGWRGLAAGVIEATLRCMCEAGADVSRIHAVGGPSIGPCCFEVGAEVVSGVGEQYATVREGAKPTIDLREAARNRLIAAGVALERIGIDTACTCCREDVFFSHRRTTKQGLRNTGRMALIAWMA
jgi:YfiH family protein